MTRVKKAELVHEATADAAGESTSEQAEPGAAGGAGEGMTTRRRRGSRGGRRRKGKSRSDAAETPSGAGVGDAPVESADGSGVVARIASADVEPAGPSSEGGEGRPDEESGGSETRRRSHRGSRGGRRRRKAADAEHVEVEHQMEDAAEPAEPEPEEPAAAASAAAAVAPAEASGTSRRGGQRRRSRNAAPSNNAVGEAPTGVAEPGTEQPDGAPIAPAEGVTPQEVAASAAASETGEDSVEDATPASGEAAESRETKRRRRGSRGGRRARERRLESPPADAVAEEPATAPEGPVASEPDVDPGEEPAPKPRRRVRSRRAGADTAPADDEAASAAAEPPAAEAAPAKPARDERPRVRDRRRPKAIVRQDEGSGFGAGVPASSPQRLGIVAEEAVQRILLVSDDGQELRVALVEDGRLAEIYIERPERKSYLGDLYKGRVESVMGGIDAAFVNFGHEKNGFLYVDEVVLPDAEKRPRRIADAVKSGQEILVQVTKDPMGHKGARLSTKISLAGRYLVYVPGGSGVGVSRRLRRSERERLREISKQLRPRNAGLIIRTLAEGHGLEDLRRDMRSLSRRWSRLKKKAETVKAPGLVYKEVDISIEAARDLFNDTCESLIVDDAKRHRAILALLNREAPELASRVQLYDGTAPLFEAHGIEDQIARALERRVALPSGGNLVIDHAEALTVIDVNSGRFTRGKGLEDTITKTNLEAAREVVRQLRLRDIGGIIIIDFIDMAYVKNREMVLATLEAELETDRTKTYVVELSPLGLVEMTRQNTTDGARGIMTRTCPACQGKARVLSEETVALNVERRLRGLARRSQAKAWLIEVNAGVAERLSGDRLKRLEKQTGRRVIFEGASSLPIDSFRILAEGAPAQVLAQRVPVSEGQEIEVELEFSLTYSPRDAVGYVDGYMVIVEGGRQYLGERRKVCITSTARTGARAIVVKRQAN